MIGTIFTWFEQYRDPFPVSLPDKPPDSLGAFIVHYARPFGPLIVACAVLSSTIALIEVYLFSFVGNLVDWVSHSERESFWQAHHGQLMAAGFLVLVVLPGLKFSYETILHQGILGNFAMRTRWQTHRYLLRQSINFFQDDFAGRVAAKMMQTSLGVRDTVIKITEVVIYVVIYFTGAVILFAASDLRMTFPMAGWLACYLAVLYYYVPRLRNVSMEQAEARSMVTGRAVDSYTNITTVKMFTHAHHEDRYAQQGMEIFLDSVYRQMRLSTKLSVFLTLINSALLFSVAASAVWLWHLDAVTAGAMAFALGLVIRLQGMSQWVVWEIWNLFENMGVVEDGIETISRNISIADRPGAGTLVVRDGLIEYENVRFNYGQDQGGDAIIENLRLRINGGEKIGIVGRSGAGKSTLVNLLLRFYDLEHGRIAIDGQDIREVRQDSLRARIAMVNQDTSLLHRSVFDNIRYGNEQATMESVVAVAKQAKADEFIRELIDPEGNRGYEAHVGERGVKLSGGQRQRIAIARVLLKNAPILILDEATSALDSEVEAAIQDNLYSLMEGKTVIAIAHRLSTIASLDRLVIMDAGKIVEQGSHEELLKLGGLYSQLWARQSGGFLAHDVAGQPEKVN